MAWQNNWFWDKFAMYVQDIKDLRVMVKDYGYGFRPVAGLSMDSGFPGMPELTRDRYLLDETLSRFSVSNPDLISVTDTLPSKVKSFRYVISLGLLYEFLEAVSENYVILPSGSNLRSVNSMVYYDLPDYRLFRDHMKGKAARCQVKLKNIQDSQYPMFEVKFRSNKGVTGKYLLPFDKDINQLFGGGVSDKFYGLTGLNVYELRPALGSCSDKFVLIDRESHERIEVDAGLQFALPGSGEDGLLIPLAVVRISGIPENESPTARFFHERRIKTMTFSRYLLGGSLLLTGMKSNRYKHKIRQIQKIVQYELAY
jgi:hypothetical protein